MVRTPRGTPLRSVLVAEDDVALCREIAQVARGWGAEALEAHTVEQAMALLGRSPELVIADLWLEGSSIVPLLEMAVHRNPAPAVVAMSGQASREETFRLGRLNVRAFLPKPLDTEALEAAVEEALGQAPDVEPWIRGLVGHASLKGAQQVVRDTMLSEALARSEGSRSRAARILQVSRQAIQQVLQRDPRRKPPEKAAGAPRR